MMIRTFITFIFLVCCVFAANPTDSERLSASFTTWKMVKESCGGNYSYKVIRSSFTGYQDETVVVVKANKVAERRFDVADAPRPGEPRMLKNKWVETGDGIGKHEGAAEPKTLDEMYSIAKQIVEAEIPANHVRSLALDKQGLLQHCFTRDTRIADGGPIKGVTTIYLTLGKK
jgi:predicted RND superfamily exporter protein